MAYISCLDTFIQKTKKLYLDTRTQRNLAKLNDELYEVHQIMTHNFQEVLGVGEKLDHEFAFAPYLCYAASFIIVFSTMDLSMISVHMRLTWVYVFP